MFNPFIVLIACALPLVFTADVYAKKNKKKLQYTEEISLKGKNVIITDGDTIKVDGIRMRMLYMDAPESKQTCKTAEGKVWACGKASTEYLKKLVLGKDIVCKIKGGDRYKRKLAHCFDGRKDINKEMVVSGYAVAYIKYGGDIYLSAQKKAMRKLRGIWSGTFIEPEFYRKLKRAPKKHITKEYKKILFREESDL